jgi:hypothetical protein
MPGVKVGNVDIQFGKDYDQAKANQLVQTLQQVVGAVNSLANQAATPTPPAPASQVLATQEGLGKYLTVAGLAAGQVLVAESPTTAHFGFLTFGELAQVDAGSFAAPANGDVISFIDGYWTANPSSFGLGDPGSDALIMWDSTADGGAGGLTWVVGGNGIALATGNVAVNDHQLTHGHLLGLLADDHPQYALVGSVPSLATANTFTALQTFALGLVSGSDIDLTGNLEQTGLEGVEDRIQNTDDAPNEGTWRMHIEPGQEMHASVSDPDPGYTLGADGANWLTVLRNQEWVQVVNLDAQYFTFNGFDVCCGELVPGSGAMPATIKGYLTVTVGGQTIKVPYLAS